MDSSTLSTRPAFASCILAFAISLHTAKTRASYISPPHQQSHHFLPSASCIREKSSTPQFASIVHYILSVAVPPVAFSIASSALPILSSSSPVPIAKQALKLVVLIVSFVPPLSSSIPSQPSPVVLASSTIPFAITPSSIVEAFATVATPSFIAAFTLINVAIGSTFRLSNRPVILRCLLIMSRYFDFINEELIDFCLIQVLLSFPSFSDFICLLVWLLILSLLGQMLVDLTCYFLQR